MIHAYVKRINYMMLAMFGTLFITGCFLHLGIEYTGVIVKMLAMYAALVIIYLFLRKAGERRPEKEKITWMPQAR